MRYQFFTNNKDIVICTSTYAGKTVKGIAKCSPEDEFDYEFGCNLALARCDAKIAEKKIKNANRWLAAALENSFEAHMEIDEAQKYMSEAYDEMLHCNHLLAELEEESREYGR